ncbi:preprotein translocase subunit SecY [Eubacteriaceae bacterium CHKCI005]|nr:preprotein translocase subunit SecY [Eubacteriaceae bacterium CHKCI005]
MFETFRNAWKIADLRKKLLFTLFIIVIFRIGAAIPVPFIDADSLKALMEDMSANSSNLLGYFNMISGGGLEKATLFAMSITPYINASIIIQLLTVAIPPLERMAKEGEEGRKRIAQITRYTTIVLGLIQATAYFFYLKQSDILVYDEGGALVFTAFVIILVLTAGSALMMWLGEQINDKGIGNGISILLFAGIVSRGPSMIMQLYQYLQLGGQYYILVPVVVIIFILIIAFIVLMTDAERRIPVQYAKRVVGRKMYGGQSTHIPVKVNMSGVLPIIFASSFLSIPSTIDMFVNQTPGGFWDGFFQAFSPSGALYAVLYFLLIIFFSYFYVSIQYNPIEMANNLKKNNGAIPGIRPGKPTSDFISRIISKVVLIGALFLGVIAILPIVFGAVTGMGGLSLGGTSILIVVGVAIETVRQIESQMLMRHYKGFLE